MAGSYTCDNGDGNVALVLLTNLETGDVLAMCPACTPDTLRGIADSMSPQAPGQPDAGVPAVPPTDPPEGQDGAQRGRDETADGEASVPAGADDPAAAATA